MKVKLSVENGRTQLLIDDKDISNITSAVSFKLNAGEIPILNLTLSPKELDVELPHCIIEALQQEIEELPEKDDA